MKILFVCMGNICRSPTAKGVFDAAIARAGLDVETDSAGTHDYHVGHPPDPRAIEMARIRQVDIAGDRARRIQVADFSRFDRILVMDRGNLEAVRALAPGEAAARVQLVMELAPEYGLEEVPDPYYGGEAGFRQVVDMLEAAAECLVAEMAEGPAGRRGA